MRRWRLLARCIIGKLHEKNDNLMLKKIIIGFVVVLGGFLLYATTLPAEMHISRELEMKAKPERIFPYINNSKKANEWMPWQDSDPGVKMSFSGPEEGVGSKSSWDSKGKMGTGEALVVESIKNQVVKTQLSYTKPFQMSQHTLSCFKLVETITGGHFKSFCAVFRKGETMRILRLFRTRFTAP